MFSPIESSDNSQIAASAFVIDLVRSCNKGYLHLGVDSEGNCDGSDGASVTSITILVPQEPSQHAAAGLVTRTVLDPTQSVSDQALEVRIPPHSESTSSFKLSSNAARQS